MNLAVRFYSDTSENENPLSIPEVWPFQVIELGDSTELPDDGHTWNLLTKEEYNEYVNEHQEEYDNWSAEQVITEYVPDVTPRQMRQALVLMGISISDIETALDSLPEPIRSLAQIEWEYSLAFQRNRPLVKQVGQLLGLNEEQLNDLWAFALTL